MVWETGEGPSAEEGAPLGRQFLKKAVDLLQQPGKGRQVAGFQPLGDPRHQPLVKLAVQPADLPPGVGEGDIDHPPVDAVARFDRQPLAAEPLCRGGEGGEGDPRLSATSPIRRDPSGPIWSRMWISVMVTRRSLRALWTNPSSTERIF